MGDTFAFLLSVIKDQNSSDYKGLAVSFIIQVQVCPTERLSRSALRGITVVTVFHIKDVLQ